MSYQVLARKWRPKLFSELVGQEHVVQALTNALNHDRLHHAYLFTGTRGVGKTTLARIFAKSLNCDEGVSATPCGVCSSCREIDEGRFADLLEIDAASRTKVDQTRELLDNVPYAPVKGRYKVYLIDEVHMFSGHSFNALLKTLEEPPPHVKFLLATTDPQKLPVTILSRCLQFNLKHLLPEQITGQLAHILQSEKIDHEQGAIDQIAASADGSMRDALSLLDQGIAYSGGQLKTDEVRTMLGTVSQDNLFGILEALLQRDGAGMMSLVDQMAAFSPDFRAAMNELLSMFHGMSAVQLNADRGRRFDALPEQLKQLANRFSPEDIQLYYQVVLNGQRDLAYAPDVRTGFEMTLLRMLAFRPAQAGAAGTVTDGTGGATVDRTVSVRNEASTSPLHSSTPVDDAPSAAAATDAQPDPVGNRVVELTGPQDWHAFIRSLGLGGMARQLAENTALTNWDKATLQLQVDDACANLRAGKACDRFEQALRDKLGADVRIEWGKAPDTPDTLARNNQRREAARQDSAEDAIRKNPYVQSLEDTFSASIDEKSVKPV